MILEYIGNGKHITGLPARDLDESDAQLINDYASLFGMTTKQCEQALIKSGLYRKPPKAVAPTLSDTTEEGD